MNARRQALAQLTRLGATLDDLSRPGGLNVTAWAPTGYLWAANGAHCVVACNYTDRAAGWAMLLSDLGHGLTACQVQDCETCPDGGALP